jgi:hypothetical protein
VDEKCVILRSYDKKLGFQIKKPHISVRLLAPLFLERCNYNAMIEYVIIRKLKG